MGTLFSPRLNLVINELHCIIQPGIANADAGVAAAWTHVGLWFWAANTTAAVGGADVNSVSVVATNPANPADMFTVGAWCAWR